MSRDPKFKMAPSTLQVSCCKFKITDTDHLKDSRVQISLVLQCMNPREGNISLPAPATR